MTPSYTMKSGLLSAPHSKVHNLLMHGITYVLKWVI